VLSHIVAAASSNPHQQSKNDTRDTAGVWRSHDPAGTREAFCAREAGAAGGEAAGLVSYKTRANEGTKANHFQSENPYFDIDFSKEKTAKKRVDRLKRGVWASGHLHGIPQKGHRPMVCWFVTLTYALADVWQARHIKRAVDGFRRWAKRKGIPAKYTWVAEIQPKRLERSGDAVVHYHAIIWLPVGVQMPHWDEGETMPSGRYREPFWPHGMTNTQKAKAGVGYLMKYLSKLGELTIFPDGLRLYGVGGLDPLARTVRAWYNLPQWVKNLYGVGDVRRLGSSMVDLSSGELLEPMFRRQFIPGGCRIHLLRDYPERWHDGAYSTLRGFDAN
jgi:hypothetical protein